MNTIEKIENYIKNTGKIGIGYDIYTNEIFEIAKMNPYDAIIVAFTYGRAKGYRAGKKEARA